MKVKGRYVKTLSFEEVIAEGAGPLKVVVEEIETRDDFSEDYFEEQLFKVELALRMRMRERLGDDAEIVFYESGHFEILIGGKPWVEEESNIDDALLAAVVALYGRVRASVESKRIFAVAWAAIQMGKAIERLKLQAHAPLIINAARHKRGVRDDKRGKEKERCGGRTYAERDNEILGRYDDELSKLPRERGSKKIAEGNVADWAEGKFGLSPKTVHKILVTKKQRDSKPS